MWSPGRVLPWLLLLAAKMAATLTSRPRSILQPLASATCSADSADPVPAAYNATADEGSRWDELEATNFSDTSARAEQLWLDVVEQDQLQAGSQELADDTGNHSLTAAAGDTGADEQQRMASQEPTDDLAGADAAASSVAWRSSMLSRPTYRAPSRVCAAC